ncbi:MAG: PaaI family thioesterase [Candidatus Binatales bacterium]
MADARTRAESIAQEAYARWLGVRIDKIEPDYARIELPYKEENSNPGKQVHGGVVASALAIAARIAARAGLEGQEPCASGMLSLNVGYLASAVGEAIFAEGRVMRRGKELCYVRSDAANPDGKPLGTATVVYRAAPGIDPAPTESVIDRSGDAVEGIEALAGALTASPFISGVGMLAEQMKDGRARLCLAHRETNAGEGGAIHEGAIAALIDTCGALSAWSLVKPQRGMRVSTVGIDVEFVNAVSDQDLIARSRTVGRKREIFFNRVEIESADGTLAAYGSVIYRIVLPE